jgi:hypothetical protein
MYEDVMVKDRLRVEKEGKDELSELDLSSFGYDTIYIHIYIYQLESNATTHNIPYLGNIFPSLSPCAWIKMPLLCVLGRG